ncbi:MAG: DUF2934 domain-containing protein [Candidatus Omnitrophica bacterium]|jgi:hypothetical protein|nr:DUF2934 domain-containing protein [Candidatus Omnitrophota bacterium]
MVKKIFRKKDRETVTKYSPQDIAKINARAYYIWLNKGKPANSAVCDWILAEKELKKEGTI